MKSFSGQAPWEISIEAVRVINQEILQWTEERRIFCGEHYQFWRSQRD